MYMLIYFISPFSIPTGDWSARIG